MTLLALVLIAFFVLRATLLKTAGFGRVGAAAVSIAAVGWLLMTIVTNLVPPLR